MNRHIHSFIFAKTSSTLRVSDSLPGTENSTMTRQIGPCLHDAPILLEYEKQSSAVNVPNTCCPSPGPETSEPSSQPGYYYYSLLTSPSIMLNAFT